MKRFIIKTTKFLLPIILIILIIEIFLREIPNDYSYKSNYISENAKEIETWVLGSSHAFYGINPVFLDSKAFNSAIISQTLEYDFEIFEKYKNKLDNLNEVLIPISSFTLFLRMNESKEYWRKKNYNIYYDINRDGDLEPNFETLSNSSMSRFDRLVSHYILGNSFRSCDSLGWGTKYSSKKKKDLEETAKKTSFNHNFDVSQERPQKNLSDSILILERIIEWCKSKGVNVILFTPPAFKTYRDRINEDQLNLIFEKSLMLSEKHNNCIYVNLFSSEEFTNNDFYDSDHLSEIGAEKLTILLNKRINKERNIH